MWMLLASAHAADLSVSYFGESLVHPGVTAQLTTEFWSRTRDGRVTATRSLAVGPRAGWAWHPGSQNLAFVAPELVYQKQRRLRWDAVVGLGVARSMPIGASVNPDGTTNLAGGSWHLMPSVGLGFGGGEHLQWHVRPTLYGLSHWNASMSPWIALETGVTWSL
ncbi:MAG: hypothetical protein GY913_03450 [Proteobacteria bacterium]|nr:hypothetical protein [Pseudomonadota bacterium]MCP4915956.1 hypothetical protein [Pseudomonadota bacterium]